MLKNDYRYVLDFYREDETGEGKQTLAVGQAIVSVDWEPARECAEFLAIRQGKLSGEESLVSSIQPAWHEQLGQPYMSGFRVEVRSNGNVEAAVDFTTAYFANVATQASARFIEQGSLKSGERFWYVASAFPHEQQQQNGSRLQLTVEEVAVKLPFKHAPLAEFYDNSIACGESGDEDIAVFIPERIMDEAAALSRQAGDKETGGILIGHLHKDTVGRDLFAEVTAQIPARHTEATLASLTFTSDTWTEVRAAIELRNKGELMLGWWHSHVAREWCKNCAVEKQKVCYYATGFFSSHDRALHRTVFPRAYSVALVVNDTAFGDPTFSMFGWRKGLIEPRGFNLIGATGNPPAVGRAQSAADCN